MPELPEVETTRRTLEPAINLFVQTVRVCAHAKISVFTDSQRGVETTAMCARSRRRALFSGDVIKTSLRHGKQLALVGDSGRVICIHLGMTGQVLLLPPGGRPKQSNHIHVQWTLQTPSGKPAGRMLFRDPRRFGGIWTFPSVDTLWEHRWSKLGPDAIDVSTSTLARALAGARGNSQRAVKAMLLDQAALAGVGNIYADEACHRAGIDPRRVASGLSRQETTKLARTIRGVLRAAVRARGSTLRDYVGADGEPGQAQIEHRVYGRAGRACLTCGEALESGVVGQRTTVWCRVCQPPD